MPLVEDWHAKVSILGVSMCQLCVVARHMFYCNAGYLEVFV